MAYTKVETVSVMEQFIRQVQDKILTGEHKPGEMLPPARELSSMTGVSRAVITAGLVELENMGFVEVKPRVGVFVRDYRRTGSVETLNAIMRHHGKLRKLEAKSLLQVRVALEELCVDLVVHDASDEEIASLLPIVDELQTAAQKNNAEETAALTFRFHHELALISGNLLLPLLYHSFSPAAINLWISFCHQYSCGKLYQNKQALCYALLNRDMQAVLQLVPAEYPADPHAYWED